MRRWGQRIGLVGLCGLLSVACGDDGGGDGAGTGSEAGSMAGMGASGTGSAGSGSGDGGSGGMSGSGGTGGMSGSGGSGGMGGSSGAEAGTAAAGTAAPCADMDGDGFADVDCGGRDCDDDDADVHPDMLEVCDNGVDDDCNPTTGDIADLDRDGFLCTEECDDHDVGVSPRRTEICDNGKDDDCDPATPDTFDADGDGDSCDVDCADGDDRRGPSAAEVCGNLVDDDCDPSTPDTFDGDGDGISCQLDCDDSDDTLPDTSYYCGSVFSYYEDFEDGPAWTASEENSSWDHGNPRNPKFIAAGEDRLGWFTQGGDGVPGSTYFTDENSWVESPSLDLTGVAQDPVLYFDRLYALAGYGHVFVSVSIDGGITWTRVRTSVLDANFYDSGLTGSEPRFDDADARPEWKRARTWLQGTAGESDVRIRFRMRSTLGVDAGFGLDNVLLVSHSFDAAVETIALPADGCMVGRDSSDVTIAVRNRSNVPIIDVPVSYQVDGGTVVTEVMPGPLAVGELGTYTFSTTADLSAVGLHQVQAWASLDGDEDGSNDGTSADTYTAPRLGTGDYSEGFETDDGGWFARGTKPTWARGRPMGDVLNTAAGGEFAFVTNPLGAHHPEEASTLSSPCLDLSSMSVDPVIAFALAYDFDDTNSSARMELSTDGGTTWAPLLGDADAVNWYNDSAGTHWERASEEGATHAYRTAHHILSGAGGEDRVQVRFRFSAGSSATSGMAIDDVAVAESFIDARVEDIGVAEILCTSEGSQSVTATIRNGGNQPLASVEVSYQIDGGTAVTETLSGPIAAGASLAHTFATPFAVPAAGQREVSVQVVASGDLDSLNDQASVSLAVLETLSLPFGSDFETDSAGLVPGGMDPSWEWGRLAGDRINTATSGVNGWATGLSMAPNPFEDSYLYMPCFDLSSVSTDPYILFQIEREMTNSYLTIEASTDGTTWNVVGSSGTGTNWYNCTSGFCGSYWTWRRAINAIAGTAGESLVRLRFHLASGTSSTTYDGLALDDLRIAEDVVDVSVSGTTVPSGSCSAPLVTTMLTNEGATDITDFDVAYSIDGGTPVVETVTTTIPPGTTIPFVFTMPAGASAGAHTVAVVSMAPGDIDTTNDMDTSMFNTPSRIAAMGYTQDFEADDGGWSVSGTNASWAWGTPSATGKSIITSTATPGLRAYITSLDTTYNASERSYLSSPCLDFSSFTTDPTLQFDLIYETENNYDEGWVEISTDGGLSFSKLGAAGEGVNWYTDTTNDWWEGTSPSWTPTSHTVDGAAGNSNVVLRFVLSTDGSAQRDGFGVDNIAIVP